MRAEERADALGGAELDERDRAYVEAETDPERRRAIVCTLETYRRPDRLAVGDPLPSLELARLDGAGTVDLGALHGRPTVLVFGSYT